MGRDAVVQKRFKKMFLSACGEGGNHNRQQLGFRSAITPEEEGHSRERGLAVRLPRSDRV